MPLDSRELRGVPPDAVSTYLRLTGWQDSGGYGRATIWSQSVDDYDVEVLLPNSSELRDYPARMTELLGTLSEVEGRSREDILRELRFPLLDVQYIRTLPESPTGTTPLAEGAKAIQGVRDLFLAAATSTVLPERGAVLPSGQKPQQARDFLEQVRLGVPTAGSYVLRVETPIGETSEVPGGARAVLLHLYRAVRSAHVAAVESARVGTPRPFERQIDQGVSANLCSALADIGGGRRSPFEFRFAWARTVPVDEPTPDLRFAREHIDALRDAQTHLKNLADTVPATVVGDVVNLDRDPEEPTGRVVIRGRVELPDGATEPPRRVAARLPLEQYDYVVQIHRPSQPARLWIIGQLRMSGRQWEFVSVDEVRIEPYA